jgi:hypothetical protein
MIEWTDCSRSPESATRKDRRRRSGSVAGKPRLVSVLCLLAIASVQLWMLHMHTLSRLQSAYDPMASISFTVNGRSIGIAASVVVEEYAFRMDCSTTDRGIEELRFARNDLGPRRRRPGGRVRVQCAPARAAGSAGEADRGCHSWRSVFATSLGQSQPARAWEAAAEAEL